MANISLRSLVKEIFGINEDSMTFDASYKKLQRMHKVFCGITGKEYSTQIDELAKIEYVYLMKTLIDKFTTTDEGAKIEKIINKQGKNQERLRLPKELDDKLLEWFEAAYKEAALRSEDEEVMLRYQSILIHKENDALMEEIIARVEADIVKINTIQDERIVNNLLITYLDILQQNEMKEHRDLIRLAKTLEDTLINKQLKNIE